MKKFLLLLLTVILSMPLVMNAQVTVQFGTGTQATSTGGNAGAPMSYGAAYSYVQQIYRASEFVAANVPAGATITSIWFYNATGVTTMPDIRTYMGPRSTEYFSSTSDWAPYNTLTLVDSGDWVAPAGWFEVVLDAPFVWDGTSNVVVGVSFRGAHSDYSTNNPNCGYQYTTQSGNAQIRRFSTTLSSCDPTSTATANSVAAARPNLKITYTVSSCPSLSPQVANIGPNSADLNWINFQQSAYSWDLLYGVDGTFDTLSGGTLLTSVTDTFYYMTGLTSNTEYKVYLKPHCSTEDGTWSSPRTFTTDVSCPSISNLHVSDISYDEATISWVPGWSETSWEIVFDTVNTAPTSISVPTYTTTDTFYHFQNLDQSVHYYAWVRADCGGGDYSVWSPVSFLTSQVPATLPYSQDWEDVVENDNWAIDNNTAVNQWYIGAAANNTVGGDSSLYISNDNGVTNAYTISSTSNVWAYRDIDFGTYAEYAVSCDVRAYGESCCDYLRIFIGQPAEPSENTVPAGAVQLGSNINLQSAFTHYTFTLGSNYSGVQRLYFLWHNDGSVGTMPPAAVDNIVVTGSNCGRPIAVMLDSTTTTSIAFHFAPALPTDGAWQVIAVPNGGQIDETLAITVYDTTYEFMGLNPSTTYQIYVRTDCGDEYSNWSQPLNAMTDCDVITSFPYVQDFNNQGSGTSAFPMCWSRYQTGTTTTYPYISTTGGGSLYFYSTSSITDYGVTDPMDLTNETPGSLVLSFDVYKSSTSYGRLDVGYMTDPTNMSTFHQLKAIYPGDLPNTSTWYPFTVVLPSYAYLPEVYIAFVAPISSTTNYAYLDNVKIDYLPDCSAPSNLAATSVAGTSALLTWDEAPYGVSDYTVEYAEAGTGNYQSQVVTGSQTMLTNLTELTSYDVMLYSNCGTDYSDTLTLTFATSCASGGDHVVGTGSNTTYQIPLNTYYNYSYVQELFLANEINASGDIHSIAFQYIYSTPQTKSNQYIYMAETDLTSLSDWIPGDSLTLVYHGSVTYSNVGPDNWVTISLDSVFNYSGTRNLVVAVKNDDGDYTTSNNNTFKTHSASGKTLQYYDDDYPFDLTNPDYADTHSDRNNIKFGMDCDYSVTCVAPNVYVSSYDATTATIAWAPGASESSWELEYKAEGDATWTSVGTVTTSPYQLTNLTSNTTYQIRMRSDCGGDNSSWATTSVTIPCYVVALPFMENFDNASGSGSSYSVPCWTKKTNYSTAYPYPSNSQSHSANYSIYFYGSSSYYSMIVSPRFDDSIIMDSLYVTFWARKTSANYFIEMGILSDPEDPTTFEPIGQFSPSATSAWEQGEFTTSSYNGNGHYLAFRVPQWISNYMYLDDIAVDYMSPCVHVENLAATNITANSADITWTAGASEDTWEIIYGTNVDFTVDVPTTVYADSFQISGLTSNTVYEVYVRAVCSGGENSTWQSINFRTACDLVSTLPYTDDFDTYGTGTTVYPPCWFKINTYTSGDRPYINSTHYAGVGSMYFFTGTSGTYNIAITPEFDAAIPINTLQATFMYRAYYASDYLIVGVMSNPTDASTFVPVDTVYPLASSVSTWVEKEVYFNQYTGTGQYVAFKNQYTTTSAYAYIDNLVIDVIPTCPKPNHLEVSASTTTSIDLGWTENGTATTWEIEYGPVGFTLGTGTVETAYTNPYTINNLTPATTYDFYVKAVCGAGDSSLYSQKLTAATECEAVTQLPYTENFDGVSGATTTSVAVNNLPLCWHNLNQGTSSSYSGYPIVYNSSTYAASGSNAMRFYIYTTSGTYDDQMAILPPIDPMYPLNTLQLSFDARNNSTYTFTLIVGVMTNPADKTTFVPLDTIVTTSNTYNSYDVVLSQYTGTGNYIAFKAPRPTSSYNSGYVDNIMVDYIPSCPKPGQLHVTNTASTSVTLDWTPHGSETSWTIAYGAPGFDPTGSSVSTVVATTHPFVVDNLTSATPYEFYVQANCAPGDDSYWAGPTAATPGSYNIPVTGTQTISTCAMVIYDDGGPTGDYSNYCDATVVINPETPGNMVSLSGTSSTESCCDWLKIYDGSSTSGTLLGTYQGENLTVPTLTSSTGPLTIQFHTDLSVVKSGFALTVSCISVSCPAPTNLTISNLGNTSATVSWTPVGTETSWVVEYKTATAANWTVATATSSTYTLTGLTALTSYQVRVKADCGSETSAYTTTSFTTPNCAAGSACQYTFVLGDGYGDGWNDGFMTVQQGGTTIAVLEAIDHQLSSTQTYDTVRLYLCDNVSTSLLWTSGSFDDEVSVYVYGPDGSTVMSQYDFDYYTTYTFTPDCGGAPATCNVPTGLAVNNVTTTTATASWTAGGTETSWNVQYKAASASNWQSATANATSYTMTGLTPGTAYQVRVQANCGAGNTSDWTTAVSFTTNQEQQTCPAPTNLTATIDATSHTTVVLTWQQAPNTANEWQVNYRISTESTWSTATATSTTYTLTDLTPNVDYVANVVAHCTNGLNSDESNTVTFHTDDVGIVGYLEKAVSLYPNPATEMISVEVSDANIMITGVEVYNVYGQLINTIVSTENPLRINISGLADGMYYVRVTTDGGVVTKNFVKK